MFTELLGRILDLDVEDWGTADNQMVITVFQYAVYFLPQGRLAIFHNIYNLQISLPSYAGSVVGGCITTVFCNRALVASQVHSVVWS